MDLKEEVVLGKTRSSSLENVTHLNLWGNELRNVSIFRQMKSVRVVSLSINKINSLKDFENCESLEELYLRKNHISDLTEIRYLKSLKKLRILWLSDNPCAEEDVDYRGKVISVLPKLKKLDSDDVGPEEVERSLERFKKWRDFVWNIRDDDDEDDEDEKEVERGKIIRPKKEKIGNIDNNSYEVKNRKSGWKVEKNEREDDSDMLLEMLDLPPVTEEREPPPYMERKNDNIDQRKRTEVKRGKESSGGGNIDQLISRNNIYNGLILLVRELDHVHLEKLEREIENLKILKKKD